MWTFCDYKISLSCSKTFGPRPVADTG